MSRQTRDRTSAEHRGFPGLMLRLGLTSLFFLCFYSTPLAAEQKVQAAADEQQQEQTAPLTADEMWKELASDDGFVYKREGRVDPFKPFLTDKSKVVKAPEAEELFGMRKFEPGQLTLVAIVFRGDEGLAMVQDPTGQGYIIRKGTKIGRSGTVENIIPNRVIIQNLTYTRAGDKRYNRVDMLLKKEGEEN
jgi:type IV pilus assembly protein PilP